MIARADIRRMGQPRLLDRLRREIRRRNYSRRTEEAYVDWVRRYVRHHGLRHPERMGSAEVVEFLSHLATSERVSASTQNQATSAIVFLYRHVLGRPLEADAHLRGNRPKRVPEKNLAATRGPGLAWKPMADSPTYVVGGAICTQRVRMARTGGNGSTGSSLAKPIGRFLNAVPPSQQRRLLCRR